MDFNTVRNQVNNYRSRGMDDNAIAVQLVRDGAEVTDIVAALHNAPDMGQAAASLANYEIKQERPEAAAPLEHVIDNEILNQNVNLYGLLDSYQSINSDDNALDFLNAEEFHTCINKLRLNGGALLQMATCIKNKKIEAYASQYLEAGVLGSLKTEGYSPDEILGMAMQVKEENLLNDQKAQDEERLLQQALKASSQAVGQNKEINQGIIADRSALEYLTDDELDGYTSMGLSLDEIILIAMQAKQEKLLQAQEEALLLEQALKASSKAVGHNREIKQEIAADDDALDYLSNEQLLAYKDMGLSPDEILVIATQVKQDKLLETQEDEQSLKQALALSKAEARKMNEKRRVIDEVIKGRTGNNYNNGGGSQGSTGLRMAKDQDHAELVMRLSEQEYLQEQREALEEIEKQNQKKA